MSQRAGFAHDIALVLHLSTLYDRKELALRMGIIFAGASASGAFGRSLTFYKLLSLICRTGGVLARGLYAIPTTSTVDYHWRWIVGLLLSPTA